MVASQYLVNVMGKNDLELMNSATGQVNYLVSSPANIFSTYAYYAGHYIYTATIDLSKVNPDQLYSISVGLQDTWNPQHSMYATTQIRVGGESMQLYPVFETFSDPGYTIPCDTFTMNDKIYVQIKTRNGYIWDAYGGSVSIKDYFGEAQINRAPELPTVSSDFTYTVTAGKATITSYIGPGGELIIPATLGGYPVTGFGTVFQGRTSLTSVTIPDSVTSIADNAFKGCSNMDWVTIGINVTSIGESAFESCTDLGLITFLGRAAPTYVGSDWIRDTLASSGTSLIRGQALASSSFLPNSDSDHRFHGLLMSVFMPVDENPVSTITQLSAPNNNTYRFTIDLALASQQPWISGQNHYTLNFDTFKTITGGHKEQYYLAKVIYVAGPIQTLDIVTAGASVGDHHRHLADSNNAVQYYLNGDGWADPYAVATYVDDGRSHHWSAPEGSVAAIGDMNGDGKADIVAILYDNAANRETETSLNIYVDDGSGNWQRSILAMLPYGAYPTALTLGNADLDNDLDIFVAFSFVAGRHHISLSAVGSVGVYLNDGAWTYEEILYSDAPVKYINVGDLDLNQGENIAGTSLDVLVGFDRIGSGLSGPFVLYRNTNHMGHVWTPIPITFSSGAPKEARGVIIDDLDSTWKNELVLLDKWQQVFVGSYDLATNTATASIIPATQRSSNLSPANTIGYGLGTGVIIGQRGERMKDIVVTVSSWSHTGRIYKTTIDITVLDQTALMNFTPHTLEDEFFYFNDDHHSWHRDTEKTNPTQTVVADVDGNGLADIVLSGSDGEIRLLRNVKGNADAASWNAVQVDMGSEGFGWTQTTKVSSLSVGNIHGGTSIGPVVVPGIPSLTADPGNVKVILNWTGPAIDGGSPITSYKLYRSTTLLGTYTLISSFSGGDTTFTDSDVVNGVTYWYKMSAVNAMGEGAQCAAVSAMPDAVKPGPPTSLSANPSGSSMVVSWGSPADNGGSPVIGYRIYRGTSAGSETFLASVGATLSYVDSSAARGFTYYYKVTAVNIKGEGSAAGPASSGVPATVPNAPGSLTVVRGNAQAVLSWDPPYNGGSSILYYKVWRSTSVGGTYTQIATPAATPYTATGLTNGVTYFFKVSAYNAQGTGAEAGPEAVVPATVPNAPTLNSATANSVKTITLQWTPVPVASNGGSAVLYYNVYRATSSGGTYVLVGTASGATASGYTDTGLTAGTYYYYKVTAVNDVGESGLSSYKYAQAKN